MAKDTWFSTPHGPLVAMGPDLWRVEAPIPNNPLRRVMTIARTTAGKLLIHSAIALDDATMKQVEALGEVAYLAVPNGFHRMDAPRYKRRYPACGSTLPGGRRTRSSRSSPSTGPTSNSPGMIGSASRPSTASASRKGRS
jgi:hypothetical protein